MPNLGILLLSHGSPAHLDDIPEFLANIRRATPPQPIVQAVRARYEAIGGSSPLPEITRAQAHAIEKKTGLPCLIATRMWHPSFEQVLREVSSAQSPTSLIVLSAAPFSAHVYTEALQTIAHRLQSQGLPIPALHPAPCWGNHPRYIQGWADATATVLDQLGIRKTARAVLVPTAHSLPLRTVQAGDPYPHLIHTAVEDFLKRLATNALPSILAFQSQGMTEEPWLGPDLPTVFERAKATGAEGVLLVPIGFPTEHVETLYDLDIEAKQIARQQGLWLERVPCLNTAEPLIDALCDLVEQTRNRSS